MKGLGSRVKEARLEIGISQKELATLVNVSQQNIGKIETGRSKATYTVVPLARALSVTPNWLLTGELPKRPSTGDDKLDLLVAQDPKKYSATTRLLDRLLALSPTQLSAIENILDAFVDPRNKP